MWTVETVVVRGGWSVKKEAAVVVHLVVRWSWTVKVVVRMLVAVGCAVLVRVI